MFRVSLFSFPFVNYSVDRFCFTNFRTLNLEAMGIIKASMHAFRSCSYGNIPEFPRCSIFMSNLDMRFFIFNLSNSCQLYGVFIEIGWIFTA
ncbi:hypothetical protein HMPREF1326_01085 [Akkermansia sp. KLE1605]|nr:hypothetical protein HMPREF1326_01085 [Akkermansia sp. KLE1605]